MTDQETNPESGDEAPVEAPKASVKKAASRAKTRSKMFALVTPYSLVHPKSKTRFTQHANVKHEEDNWVKAQMKAGLLIEVS